MIKRRKFLFKRFALFLIVLIVFIVLCSVLVYKFETSAVSSKSKKVVLEIEKGDNYYNITDKLVSKNLIKSVIFYRIFLRFNKPNSLTVGKYELNQNMNLQKIVSFLSNSKNALDTSVKITFTEGTSVEKIAKIVAKNTKISSADFLDKINDDEYIDSLEEKYWFITDDVKNSQLYYALEGYLFPDTYIFDSNEVSLDKVLGTIMENTSKKLESVREASNNSKLSIHQILTLASLIQLESVTYEDMRNVSGVFYNRLNNNWSLGSDVTTYYSAKKSLTEKLTADELSACNGYNTRCLTMKGLPIGPIDNPGLDAIKAAINPINNDYYYFVADNKKKVYFTKNANEHAAIIAKLKKEGKWIG